MKSNIVPVSDHKLAAAAVALIEMNPPPEGPDWDALIAAAPRALAIKCRNGKIMHFQDNQEYTHRRRPLIDHDGRMLNPSYDPPIQT